MRVKQYNPLKDRDEARLTLSIGLPLYIFDVMVISVILKSATSAKVFEDGTLRNTKASTKRSDSSFINPPKNRIV
jgi:hypothetical protein